MSVKMNLENHILPVTDVDRAKEFYGRLGWRLDDDVAPMDGLRFIQFTPPGSPASVTFGLGLHTAAPGGTQGTLVVSDIEEAHDGLLKLGIDVSDVWHGPPFPVEARQPGVDPEHTSYGSFCSFNDPDGNLWIVQEGTTRRPGRERLAGVTQLERPRASQGRPPGRPIRTFATRAQRESRNGERQWLLSPSAPRTAPPSRSTTRTTAVAARS